MNIVRYGPIAVGKPNCQANLEAAIRGYGMAPKMIPVQLVMVAPKPAPSRPSRPPQRAGR